MSKRGRIPLEIKMGEARFKALLKTMEIPAIASLICEHQIGEEEKSKCEACRRAIYRAKERLEAAERTDKTFQPIDQFEAIPEIQELIHYAKSKGLKDDKTRSQINMLFRMWTWIRESGNPELIETQRPIVWNIKHIQAILIKVNELQISHYGWVQALRHLFKSMRRHEMLNESLLKARRRDMRSPKGASRTKDRFTPTEYIQKIRPLLTEQEAFIVDLHLTLKAREGDQGKGSLLGLKWENIDWNDNFYGFPAVTATVYEPKTGGGTRWEHCLVDLWFADLSTRLKQHYENRKGEYVCDLGKTQYQDLWNRISEKTGENYEAHDCRRSPSGWLRDLGLSDLAIGQYDARSGKATGYAGVGWENSEIFFQRYGKMNPLAIFDKKKRLDTSMFNGLINKILEQKNQ